MFTLTTVQMTNLPLWRKIGMICFAKSGQTEDLYSVEERIFNIMLYVQYVHSLLRFSRCGKLVAELQDTLGTQKTGNVRR
jgi:hypothetical protein